MEADKNYFITATILGWKHLLKSDIYKDILINEWRHRVQLNHLKVYAFVIMPNHYHAVISTPSPFDPSDIQRDIHKWTSRKLISELKKKPSAALESFASNSADRKYQIWQRNSLPILIYSTAVMNQKIDYIHNNPLQEHWKLAAIPEDYVYSSARFYLCNETNWDFISHFSE